MRRTITLSVALLQLLLSTAQATPTVGLHAELQPERLGGGTTIEFAFKVATPHNHLPPPLVSLKLSYPANIGLVTSGLGLERCFPATLEVLGPTACPADSLMGHGSALVEIPVGPDIIEEVGEITAWMGPIEGGHLSLLFYADGEQPVYAQLIFPGLILPAARPFGGEVNTSIPIIPSLPDAPDATVVEMHSTIGPRGITYYERRGAKEISYHPKGILLPPSCPRGGFPFAASLTFLDGSRAESHTSVACPRQHLR